MKHKTLWQLLLGTLFGGTLGLAAVGCLVSAYDFSASLWAVGIFCVATAFFRSLPKGQYIAGALLLIATVWLLWNGVLIHSAEGLLFRISEIYQMGYGWPVVRWSELEPGMLDKAMPVVLYLLGSLISLFAARAVAGKSCVPAVLLTLVTLGACFVVTDKVPDTAWVFITFFAGAMLLFSSFLGKQNKPQSMKLLLCAGIPVFLCVLLLFAFVPKNGYDGAARAEKWTEEIVALWDRLMGRYPELSGSNTVDLTDVGRQSYFDSEVLQVTAQVDGKLYLRGKALDTYDGRSWTDSGTDLKLPWPQEEELELIGEVEISTQYVHRMLYLPYYTQSLDMNMYPVGKVNEHKLKYYSVTCARLPDEDILKAYYPDPYNNLHVLGIDASDFTNLPSSTQRWARQLVAEITGGKQSLYHIAKDIEEYVENSATYNLKTDRMPLGQSDFARWFLEDSETGYCVHFATAATVLLRSAGIPARYVTGYMVDAKAGEPTVVTDADAHAWVEYWLAPFGWVVLEATPASVVPSVEPTETRPTTEPTQTIVEKDDTDAPQPTSWTVPELVWWLLGTAGFALLLWLQRKVRLHLLRVRLGRGDRNQRLLTRWQYLALCHRYLPAPPDKRCLELAEKAKFSQYTITREELGELELALEAAHKALKDRNIFLQIFYRLVLVLY